MKAILVSAAIVAGAALTISAGAIAAPSDTRCPVMAGSSWKYMGKTGTHYQVVTRGTATCALAKPYVVRLSRTHKPTGTLAGGPVGFKCLAPGDANNFSCFDLKNPGNAFVGVHALN
jgi:hypothetical protein